MAFLFTRILTIRNILLGTLLLCLPATRAQVCIEELRSAGLPAAQIGELAAHGDDVVPPVPARCEPLVPRELGEHVGVPW